MSSTKYQYQVLPGEVQLRCRDLLRQTCNALDVRILKGVVSKDHIHLHVSSFAGAKRTDAPAERT